MIYGLRFAVKKCFTKRRRRARTSKEICKFLRHITDLFFWVCCKSLIAKHLAHVKKIVKALQNLEGFLPHQAKILRSLDVLWFFLFRIVFNAWGSHFLDRGVHSAFSALFEGFATGPLRVNLWLLCATFFPDTAIPLFMISTQRYFGIFFALGVRVENGVLQVAILAKLKKRFRNHL